MKTKIRIAGNLDAPCLAALRSKGFDVSLSFVKLDTGYQSDWLATKDGNSFSATTLPELLGIVSMWEVRGASWQASDDEHAALNELHESAQTFNQEGQPVQDDDA